MATNSNLEEGYKNGIIILGNAGAGKSYICNLLLGKRIFETAFQPDVVTYQTEQYPANSSKPGMYMFNVPGLIEADDDLIKRNKCEIIKAFQMCQTSVVIFVWRETGGRAQSDDIIAFNALNSAYGFPVQSIIFVVNNIPSNRPVDYDAKFIVTLSKLLKTRMVSMENTFFLERLHCTDNDKIVVNREALWSTLSKKQPFRHKQDVNISLQLDEIRALKMTLRKQEEELERDKVALQHEIDEMAEQYRRAKVDANKKVAAVHKELDELRDDSNEHGYCRKQWADDFVAVCKVIKDSMSNRPPDHRLSGMTVNTDLKTKLENSTDDYFNQLSTHMEEFRRSVNNTNNEYIQRARQLIPMESNTIDTTIGRQFDSYS